MGTSQVPKKAPPLRWDHPHACGDKEIKPVELRTVTGSSPRVWGQAQLRKLSMFAVGIIPTRVGTSDQYIRRSYKGGDHPHACGDKKDVKIMHDTNNGSSPRVWGQGITFPLSSLQIRIIPTRVGTRCILRCGQRSHGDHPHACGDKCLLPPNNRPCLGSSPRVWGQAFRFRTI